MPQVTLDLDQNELNELVQKVYRDWATAFDSLKTAKSATWESQGKFCHKADWPNYKTLQVNDATQREADAKSLLNKVQHLAKYG